MSIFVPGTTSDLKSVTKPGALFELARLLNTAENTRNAANTAIAPINDISINLNLDGGVASIAATIPIISTLVNGVPTLTASNYIGAPYSALSPGTGGDLKSTNLVAGFLEISQILASAEKAVIPLTNQPNNIQITYDLELSIATISANLPFSTSTSATGQISILAIDYL